MKMRYPALAALNAALLGGLIVMGPLTRDALAQGTPDQARGQAVFNHWCSPCHAAGPGHPGTQGLELKYRDSGVPAVLEERKDLAPEFVRTIVRQGMFSMAPFRKTEITDAELADIVAYLSK